MTQVQDSSDCCIYSKFSSAQKGYFQDECLSLFIKKLHPRSPIINRGYYIRFKVIEEVFQAWRFCLNSCSYKKCQIISLGAGYDSSYFRLKKEDKLPSGCHYIEIDFPNVLRKKLDCVRNVLHSETPVLNENPFKNPAIIFHNEEYSMLGVDLTDTLALQKHLDHVGVKFNVPTLFLSECSITYIDSSSSEKLIAWTQSHFPNAVFVTYEQVYPQDAFGLIMRNHFDQVGCSLKSITNYPDEKSQMDRFKKQGWSDCSVVTVYDFFHSLPPEEKQRVQDLEPFDEYEMWHEKCHHYILAWAEQGMLASLSLSALIASKSSEKPGANIFNFSSGCNRSNKEIHEVGELHECPSNPGCTVQHRSFFWKLEASHEVTQRFGHQTLPVSSSIMMLSGGFGLYNKKHQKLGDLLLYHPQSNVHLPVARMEARMFHSMTALTCSSIVILGGRSSPKKPFQEVLVVDCSHLPSLKIFPSSSSFENSLLPVCSYSMPFPVWRHSASLVEIGGVECIVLFGGCSLDHVTHNCCILNTKTWEWSQVDIQQCTPSARHSHSATVYPNESSILITGGLSRDEIILGSVHLLSYKGEPRWSTLQVSGLLPRYSHTSHVWKNYLLLVGGITSSASPKLGLGVVNLKTLQALELSPPGQDPEYPILLCNHSSYLQDDEIVIVGGGGNCFSFGTHFNKKVISINVPSVLL